MKNGHRLRDGGWRWLAGTVAIVALLVAALLIVSAGAARADDGLPTEVAIVPYQSAAAPGDAFSVNVVITEAVDLTAYQFELAFDPTVVTVTSVSNGEFLSGAFGVGRLVSEGVYFFGATKLGTNVLGTSGSGVLAFVELQAVAPGTSSLDLRKVEVRDVQDTIVTLDDSAVHDGLVDVAEPGSVYAVTLEATPLDLQVGQTSSLTATVRDLMGSRLSDRNVVFTTDLGELGSQVITRTTDAQGEACASLTSTAVGTATVSATAEGVAADPVEVVFAAGDVATVSLAADPTSLTVGASSSLTATLLDTYANPVPGEDVLFTTDLGSLGSGSVVRTTDAQGRAFATLTSTAAGTATVVAAAGGEEDQVEVVFEPGDPQRIEVAPDPATVAVTRTLQFEVTGYDTFDNPVIIEPTWSVSDPDAGTIDPVSGLFTAGTLPGFYPDAVLAAAQGFTATADVTVTEGCDEVVIGALVSNSPVRLGEPMTFTATVSGSPPVSYGWDFDGDGEVEDDGSVDGEAVTGSFEYQGVGTYTVILIVENPCSSDQVTLPSVRVERHMVYLPVILKSAP